MSEITIIPNRIPSEIMKGKKYEDIILYALSAFGPLEREIFINVPEVVTDRMNRNTFHKWAKDLRLKWQPQMAGSGL